MSVIADRYELGESLGHGGMARVFAADDRVLHRRVAVKLLRDDIGRDEVLRERFLREARMAASLNHPYIVRVYDAGIDAETPWIAMELVDGPSLREAMSERGPYDAEEAVTLTTQLLSALAAAHASGVVHRDIKPANILMAEDGLKLSDFGIAKSLQGGADLTQTNQFMGTPKYTAPEVAMGHPATPQADVYSAGVLLWELLAGHPPYEHDNPLSLAMMHRTDPLPSLAAERPDLPTSLVAAIEAGLAKEPPDRPVDADAFARLLEAGLRDDPAAAAYAATSVLPRMPAPMPAPTSPPREQTVAMPRPAIPPTPGPRRPAPSRRAPARRQRTGGWGVAVVAVALLLIAAFAFTRTSVTDAPGATETPTAPTPTPAATAEPTAVDTAPSTPDPDPEPPPAPPPPPEPDPDPEPTTQPTTQPTPPPVAPAPAEPPAAIDPSPTTDAPAPAPRPTQQQLPPQEIPLPEDEEEEG